MQWISSNASAVWQTQPIAEATEAADLRLTGARHQMVKGFGGCFNELGWEALQRLNASDRDAVMDQLFSGGDGCGFTFCRVPIGASDYAVEWYSNNETDGDVEMKHFSIERDKRYLIPYIHEAMKRQPELSLFASPWSPPVWMKTLKAYNYGRLRREPAILEAYALYFQKFVEAYAAEGIRIEQVHIQNEPHSNQKFPSCLMPMEQMGDFIRDYIGPRFEREGMECEIWAGTIERSCWSTDEAERFAALAHILLKDASVRRYVRGMGFQWDGKGLIQRVHHACPELPLIQTENECGDGQNTWSYAIYVFDLIWHYFTNGVCAYTYWNMVLPQGGESTWGWKQNSMVCVDNGNKPVYNPEFYVMKHLAHFVKPGATRLGMQGVWSALALAFENPDKSTVVFLCNPHATVEPVQIELNGKAYRLELPPRSVNTICV